MLPWEDPNAPEHVRTRQAIRQIPFPPGVRRDLPRRRPADVLSPVCQSLDFEIGVMTHRGSSNGRLSALLSSIPANYRVVVSSDSVDPADVERDHQVCDYHGAEFRHLTPWAGRSGNAINTMRVTGRELILFLNDDVWLMPECVSDLLRWWVIFKNQGLPIASLMVPGWSSYEHYFEWGFNSWAECYIECARLDGVPPHPQQTILPALYKNPFGACMAIYRPAYEELGGFTTKFWAQDDVFCHQVWASDKWVSAGYPGRGYIHFGAQSWHHGESQEYVGDYSAAVGMPIEDSRRLQEDAINRWAERLGDTFVKLGGMRRA